MNKDFTTVFIVGPERWEELYNAFASYIQIGGDPTKCMFIFNPFFPEYNQIFDIKQFREASIIKLDKFHGLSKAWNLSLILSSTRYNLICNDDILFKYTNTFEQILNKHQEGHAIIAAAENLSGFSIDKKLIGEIGWFDENYLHAWEDIDFKFRLERNNIELYRFNPPIIEHLRSQKGHNEKYWEYWHYGSDYFCRKWNIKEYANINTPEELTQQQRQQLLFNKFFDNLPARELNPKWVTPDFYPKEKEKFTNANF